MSPSLLDRYGERLAWPDLLAANERYWQTHDRWGDPLLSVIAPAKFVVPEESCADCQSGHHRGCSGRRKLRRGVRESYPCECAVLGHGRAS